MNTDLAKVVAIGSMVVAHAGMAFMPAFDPFWFSIGRFAFPLFVLLVAYNAVHRSRDCGRFGGRLLAWGVVSQPIYSWARDDATTLNVLFTLGLGVMLFSWFRKDYLRRGPWLLAAIAAAFAWETAHGLYWIEYWSVGVAAVVFAGAMFEQGDLSLCCAGGGCAETRDLHRREQLWWFAAVVGCIVLAHLPYVAVSTVLYATLAGVAVCLWSRLTRVEWRAPDWFRRGVIWYAFYPAHIGLFGVVVWLTA